MAVGQVDDVGNGWEHGSLAAGTNGCALLTHSQEELERIVGKKTSLKQTPGWHWECVNTQEHPDIRTDAHIQTTQVHRSGHSTPAQVSCRPELAFQLPLAQLPLA